LRSSEKVLSIQALRAAAALMVAVAHIHPEMGTFGTDIAFPNFVGGAFGVDLFFVISGFVMVYSSERLIGQPHAPIRFFARRLVRIAPLYWLATIATVHFMRPDASTALIAASLSFWPFPPGDVPVLGVGWTLNIEMFFYVAFAFALLAPTRFAAVAWAGAFLLFVAALPHIGWSAIGNTMLVQFVAGMVIGLIYRAGVRLPIWTTLGCVAIAFVLYVVATPSIIIWTLAPGPGYVWTFPRTWAWGIPASLLIAGLSLSSVLAPQRGLIIAAIVFLGDASYALYLTHNLTYSLLGQWTAGHGINPLQCGFTAA
jgi:peptidoglycan/LPS O-acetylase OafA/YrhL